MVWEGLKIETYGTQQKCVTYNTTGIYKAEEPETVEGTALAILRDIIFRFMKDCEKSNIQRKPQLGLLPCC